MALFAGPRAWPGGCRQAGGAAGRRGTGAVCGERRSRQKVNAWRRAQPAEISGLAGYTHRTWLTNRKKLVARTGGAQPIEAAPSASSSKPSGIVKASSRDSGGPAK